MLEAFWQHELCKLLTNWSQLREQCLDVSASFALDKQHCNITPQLYQHGHKVSKLLAMSLYQCSQWRLKVKICENWGQKGKLHVEKTWPKDTDVQTVLLQGCWYPSQERSCERVVWNLQPAGIAAWIWNVWTALITVTLLTTGRHRFYEKKIMYLQ